MYSLDNLIDSIGSEHDVFKLKDNMRKALSDLRKIFHEDLAQARADALEDAAKVCEDNVTGIWWTYDYAKMIRALKPGGK